MKRNRIAILFGVLFSSGVLMLTACSHFQRSGSSGYAGRDVTPSSTGDDLGSARATVGTDQIEAAQKRQRVHALESRLDSLREKEQYSKILPWLKNDDEKIEFLSLRGLEARQAWVNEKAVWKRAQAPDPDLKEASDSGDIAVGMAMDYVKKAWGEPQSVEVSGNPLYKNERWKYTKFVSTQDGFKQEKRFVYFEGGKVVGWETE